MGNVAILNFERVKRPWSLPASKQQGHLGQSVICNINLRVAGTITDGSGLQGFNRIPTLGGKKNAIFDRKKWGQISEWMIFDIWMIWRLESLLSDWHLRQSFLDLRACFSHLIPQMVDCPPANQHNIYGTSPCWIPICSMYGVFAYIYTINEPDVGKYTIHGAYGISKSTISGQLPARKLLNYQRINNENTRQSSSANPGLG